jgi:predicted alpha/beta-fold hydrolase
VSDPTKPHACVPAVVMFHGLAGDTETTLH